MSGKVGEIQVPRSEKEVANASFSPSLQKIALV
jgi:hypothetical protein